MGSGHHFMVVAVLTIMGLGLGGCVSTGPRLALAPQSSARYQCGPTTLASVLAHHGTSVPELDISRTIFSPTARGVLLTDLAWYARIRGFRTEVKTGSLPDLEAALSRGLPPIVLLDLGIAGIRQPHITAITGWSEDGVNYLSTSAAGRRVSRQTFQRQWQRAGNQFLLITPSP